MTSSRHFVLSFLGPIITGGLFCGLVVINWRLLEEHRLEPLVTMLVGAVTVWVATRWYVRNFVAVRCPFCGGKSYEISERGNRFMCLNCGKDH
jgi:predicted RNA-binding Zn-ribbon protein involved in translation (DUF1610 family)